MTLSSRLNAKHMTSARPPVQRSRNSRSKTTAQTLGCSARALAASCGAWATAISDSPGHPQEGVAEAGAVELEGAQREAGVEERAQHVVRRRAAAVGISRRRQLDGQPPG